MVCTSDEQNLEEMGTYLLKSCRGGRHLFHFRETDSTSNRAHELARKGYPEGTVVLADSQTMGRGQLGRSWYSPKGKGIYLSLILRPDTNPARMPGITLMTAVCLAEAFTDTCGVVASIKWPNDLLVRGRKLSGILTEMALTGETLDYVIVGVGINLTHGEDDFPEEIRSRSTSIMMETGTLPDRTSIVGSFLGRFERAYREFLEEGSGSFAERWKSLSGMVGKAVVVEYAGTVLEGTVSGIDEIGALLVRDRDGRDRRILSGQVSLVG